MKSFLKYFIITFFILILNLNSNIYSFTGWIEDDFQKALTLAKKENKLIFADFWAVWCYSCHHVNENVLPELEARNAFEGFVKVSLNTDNKINTELVMKTKLSSWPTFIIYDSNGKELRRLGGENTTNNLSLFIKDKLNKSSYQDLSKKISEFRDKKKKKDCLKLASNLAKSELSDRNKRKLKKMKKELGV
ncbi:MAG: thioredoxin family protein [Pseudomonadota bacterium]